MIAILGSRKDPHVNLVATVLKEKYQVEHIIIDYLSITKIALHQDRNGQISIDVENKRITKPILVWDRVKLLPGTDLYLQGSEEDVGFAANEWRAFYRLFSRLASFGVVNELFSHTYLFKPIQQRIAADAGFLVPSTLVTNVKEAAYNFLSGNKSNTIMKSLSGAKIKPSGEGECIPFNIMTMRVDRSDLENSDSRQIEFCPHFFQEEIRKDYELRVVYVAGRIFAFRINSQAYKTTEVDWRKGLWALNYMLTDLDASVVAKLEIFMKKANLFSGSIDLIVDTQGETWFLECNQDGAWGWLNDLCDGAIAEAYADALTERLRSLVAQSHEVTAIQ